TTSLRNEISNFQQRFDESFHEAWDRYKDLLRACPHHGFTELHQLDTFYNSLNLADKDSLNSAAGGNLSERRTQDVLTIIENKSKVRNSRKKSIVSQVKSYDANSNSSLEIAKLTHAVNQQTSVVTTAMTAILKQFQATPPPASVKAVKEIYVTCGGAHPYYQCLTAGGNTFLELKDNIQGCVSVAAVNYNQGSLPSNTIANLKGELKAITTQSGGGGTLMVYSERSGSVKVSSTRSSSSGLMNEGGVGTIGPSRTIPLRVVMALSSPFGLETVLLGRDPDPEVEAVFIWKRLAIIFLISTNDY
nr:reverse transcriptase domain-containing protein [Tanacetum cinerariifolium]